MSDYKREMLKRTLALIQERDVNDIELSSFQLGIVMDSMSPELVELINMFELVEVENEKAAELFYMMGLGGLLKEQADE